MRRISTDVLIVGGGAAGCFAAIKAKEAGVERVTILEKGYVGKSGCSKFAAGSFKCYIPGEDSFDLWFRKAVEEGWFINDQDWTRLHLEEVFARARELEEWGVAFLKDENNRFARLEGQGSSTDRPIKTMMFPGPQLMDVLRRVVARHSVQILDKTFAYQLLADRNGSRAAGVYAFELVSGEHMAVQANAVVLTTGAQAYKSHYAYQKMVTGDGHVMGLRAGAELMNYEFCCHHLSCANIDTTGMNVLQGVGARFVNRSGEIFMEKYDPEYGDHASMNRLSAGMACEVVQGNGPIYYDFSRFKASTLEYFKTTLPIMYKAFERAGYIADGRIRPRVEWSSVNMGNVGYGGGLRVDTTCRTNIPGLFAAGDATCGPASGVEGFCAYAIPFAVTSGAISGLAAARFIAGNDGSSPDPDQISAYGEELNKPLERPVGSDPEYVLLKVQELLFPLEVYLLRTEARLRNSLAGIMEIKNELVPNLLAADPHQLRMAVEAANIVRCGELFLTAALARTESRGSHLRLDHLMVDNLDWLKWVVLKDSGAGIVTELVPIPIEAYPIQPDWIRYKHPVAEVMEANGTPLSPSGAEVQTWE